MNIGDYVRTKRGQIHKITDLKGYYENNELIEDKQYVHIDNHFSGWDLGQFQELIVKSSPNIIDLIEVGDYVNGYQVMDFMLENGERKGIIVNADIWGFDKNEIKSIVTKECFENMEYKL